MRNPFEKTISRLAVLALGVVSSLTTVGISASPAWAVACTPASTTYSSGSTTYQVLTFSTTGDCTWTVPTGVTSVDYLVVGGGGGGGGIGGRNNFSGGGGAGGSVSAGSAHAVTPSATISVSVGAGGAGGDASANTGVPTEGASSVFDSVTANGGGRGGHAVQGSYSGSYSSSDGSAPTGGSKNGGGGGAQALAFTGASGSPYSGGSGYGSGSATTQAAGGGAGAGSNGGNASSSVGGQGGSGVASSITGTSVRYGGGGGGSTPVITGSTAGAGQDGGGAGGRWASGSNGTNGRGGGGGGGGSSSRTTTLSTGGSGGSGVVIVRYVLNPGVPTAVSATPAETSIDISFTAPTYLGGTSIADYEYSLNSGSWVSFASASAGTKTISGLTASTAYAVRVRAKNSDGYYSAASSSVSTTTTASSLSGTAPGSPSISAVSAGDQSISITFTAPASDGGQAITDYEYSLDGLLWTSFGSASAGTKTISSLENGHAYTVRVRAKNAIGAGAADTASIEVTPRGPQTITWSPTNTAVTVASGSVSLSPAASALGGATIEYSVVDAGTTSCAIASASSPTVSYSADGACVVRATAVEGGAYLSAYTDVTLTISKSNQAISFASLTNKIYGDNTFSVAPTSNSGLSVSVDSTTTDVCTVSSGTVTIVGAGTCTLRATQTGNAAYNAATAVTRSFDVARKNVTVTVAFDDKYYDGTTDATVSGTPTLSGVVSGDENYVSIDVTKITGAFATATVGSSKPITVTFATGALTAGPSGDRSANYTISGYGSPTASISLSGTAPDAPTITSVSAGNQTITISFSAPTNDGGQPIDGYQYSLNGVTWLNFATATTTAGTKTISSLTNGTAYTVRVRAKNAIGPGTEATASAVTPRGPQTLTWSPSNTSLFVASGSTTLAPAASALGGATIEYSVYSAGTTSCAIADPSVPTVTYSAEGDCVVRATALEGGAYLSATVDVTVALSKTAQSISFASLTNKTYGDATFTVSPAASSGLSVTVASTTTGVCTVDAGTVTIVGAGTCTLRATQSGNDAYTEAVAVTRTMTVAPKPVTVSIAFADKSYDGSSAATITGTPTLTGVLVGDANYVTLDTGKISGAFASPAVATNKAVTVTFAAGALAAGSSGNRSGRYVISGYGSPEATIAKATQSALSFTSLNSMVFGQSVTLVAVGGSSSGTVSYAKVSGDCTVAGSTATSTGAGTCVVTATRAGDNNYDPITSSPFTISIAAANQSISFTSTVPATVTTGMTFVPSATSTSGLSVSFAITAGSNAVCTLISGVVTMTASGTCTIEASQAGNANFNAATVVTQSVSVGLTNQTITFPALDDKTYTSPAFPVTATVSSGRAVTFSTSTGTVCSVNASTGVVSILAVGDCTITASSGGTVAYAAASDVTRTFAVNPVVAAKPSITSVSYGDSRVTVAFAAPGFTGGVAIGGYEVVATADGDEVREPGCAVNSPCTISGLTNGLAYTLTVAAVNAAGVGPESDASPTIIPAAAPDAVSDLSTTPADGVLTIDWTPLSVGQLGGAEFTRYDVSIRVRGESWSDPVNPDVVNTLDNRFTDTYTFTGLVNGQAYDVRIVAITSVNGEALASNTTVAYGVPATAPGAPDELGLALIDDTSAVASWAPPVDDGGAVVTAYDVSVDGADGCVLVNDSDTFCTLEGLTPGTEVTITVGAVNMLGEGSTATASLTVPGGTDNGGGDNGGGDNTDTPSDNSSNVDEPTTVIDDTTDEEVAPTPTPVATDDTETKTPQSVGDDSSNAFDAQTALLILVTVLVAGVIIVALVRRSRRDQR